MLLSFLEVIAGFAGGWSQVSGLYPNPLSDAYPLSSSPISVLNHSAERHRLPHGLIPRDIPPKGSEDAGPPSDVTGQATCGCERWGKRICGSSIRCENLGPGL